MLQEIATKPTKKTRSGRNSPIVTITMRPDIAKAARKAAHARGLSLSGYIAMLICADTNRSAETGR